MVIKMEIQQGYAETNRHHWYNKSLTVINATIHQQYVKSITLQLYVKNTTHQMYVKLTDINGLHINGIIKY